MPNINLGDIVRLLPIYGAGRLTEKEKLRRWKVEAFDDLDDLNGYPIVSCRRLDTKTHRLEHWTTQYLEKVPSV